MRLTDSKELVNKIAELSLDKKAVDVVSLDLRELNLVTDFFIIATGEVDIHLKAIAEHVLDSCKNENIIPLNVEGLDNRRWVLIDYVDVVFHIFIPEAREFYAIERLWGEAEITRHD